MLLRSLEPNGPKRYFATTIMGKSDSILPVPAFYCIFDHVTVSNLRFSSTQQLRAWLNYPFLTTRKAQLENYGLFFCLV
jgi:hypothetical protein